MTDHDPLCQASLNGNDDIYFCICEFITKVRADERKHQGALFLDASGVGNVLAASIQEAIRADLRARVEALPPWLSTSSPLMLAVSRADVLALIDGDSE